MRPRKCEISNSDGELFPASFHGFFSTGRGGVCAIIERENGNVEMCEVEDVHFLEQEHPRVEVCPPNKESRQGEFQGWYQYQDEDGGNPVALVRFDDGTVDTFPAWRVRFLKGGSNGQ